MFKLGKRLVNSDSTLNRVDTEHHFTPNENKDFEETYSLQRTLWAESRKLYLIGIGSAAVTIILFRIVPSLAGTPSALPEEIRLWATYVSADLASKILSINATLVVAFALVVRTIAADKQPVNLARIRTLSSMAESLAYVSAFLASMSIYSAVSISTETGILPGLVMLFVALAICVLSGDAAIQLGKANSRHPRFNAWVLDQYAKEFETIGSSRQLGTFKVQDNRAVTTAFAILDSIVLGAVVGLMVGLSYLIGTDLEVREFLTPLLDSVWVSIHRWIALMWLTYFIVRSITMRQWDWLIINVLLSGIIVAGIVSRFPVDFVSGQSSWNLIRITTSWLLQFAAPILVVLYFLLARRPTSKIAILGYHFRELLSDAAWREKSRLRGLADVARHKAAEEEARANAVVVGAADSPSGSTPNDSARRFNMPWRRMPANTRQTRR